MKNRISTIFNRFKNTTNTLFKSIGALSTKNKVIGMIALFILSFGIIIPMTGHSYAATQYILIQYNVNGGIIADNHL